MKHCRFIMGITSVVEHRLCFEQDAEKKKAIDQVNTATEEATKAAETPDKKKPKEEAKDRQTDAEKKAREVKEQADKLKKTSSEVQLPPEMQQGIDTLRKTLDTVNITDEAKEGIMKFITIIMSLVQAFREAFPSANTPEQKKEVAPGNTKPSESTTGEGGKGTDTPKENGAPTTSNEKKEAAPEKDLEEVQNPIKTAEEMRGKISALKDEITKIDDDVHDQSKAVRDALMTKIDELDAMKVREKDLQKEHERRSEMMKNEKFSENCFVQGVSLGQAGEEGDDLTFAFRTEGKDGNVMKQEFQRNLPQELKDNITLDAGAQTITIKNVPARFFAEKQPNAALRITLFEILKKFNVVSIKPSKGSGLLDGSPEETPESLEQLSDKLNASINDLKSSLDKLGENQTKLSPLCRIILKTSEKPFTVAEGKIVFATGDVDAVKIIGEKIGYTMERLANGNEEFRNSNGQKIDISDGKATIDLDELYYLPGAKTQKECAEAILAKIEDFKFSLIDPSAISKNQLAINKRMESFDETPEYKGGEWIVDEAKTKQIQEFAATLPEDIKNRVFGEFFKVSKVVQDPEGRILLATEFKNQAVFKAGCIALIRKGEFVNRLKAGDEKTVEQVGVVAPSDLTGMLEGLKLRWVVGESRPADGDRSILPKDPSPEREKKGKEAMATELASRVEDIRRTLVQEGEANAKAKVQELNIFTEQFITEHERGALECIAVALRDFRSVVTKDFQTFRFVDRSMSAFSEKNVFELKEQFGDFVLGTEYEKTIDASIKGFEESGFTNENNLGIATLNNVLSYNIRGSISDWNLEYLVQRTLEKCPKMQKEITFQDFEFKIK